MLDALPFVPPATWKEVRLDGKSSGAIDLRYDTTKQELHYQIDLQAEQTRVTLPALALTADDVSGTVRVATG